MRHLSPPIILSENDFRALKGIIKLLPKQAREKLEDLENELDRATIVPYEALPADVVSVNSTVVYENQNNGKTRSLLLTLPEEADVNLEKISVFAPVGAALLGLRVGQKISWLLPDGTSAVFRIKSVEQPQRVYERANGTY